VTSESPPDPGVVLVTQELSIRQSQEPGVLIGKRLYSRYLERMEDCKSHGWSDFWLAAAGIGGGLATAALVAALALPSTVPATDKDILWMLVILGGIVLILCLLAYFTQRYHHEKEIDSLKKDLEIYLGEVDLAYPSP
jgi:hypothetical protein